MIGLYNPLTNPHTVDINEERAMYWLNVGAQPTDTVKSLFRQKGIILKRELIRKGLSEDKIQIEIENWEKLKEAKAKSTISKKISKKAKVAESKLAEEKAVATEKVVVEEKSAEPAAAAEEKVEKNIENSTAEVKGATSEGTVAEKE
jgi:small subunit ribosomal protein S16